MQYLDERTFKGVYEHWGNTMPLMACEELGELIQVISKCERYGCYKKDTIRTDILHDLSDEMADVIISIRALCHRYDIPYEDVECRMEDKLRKSYGRQMDWDWLEEHGVTDVATCNIIARSRLDLLTFAQLTKKQLSNLKGVGPKRLPQLMKVQELILQEYDE